MSLEEIRKSITEMDDDELRDALREIRASRRTPKASANRMKAKAVANNEPTKASVGSLLSNLSADDKAALLKQLMGD